MRRLQSVSAIKETPAQQRDTECMKVTFARGNINGIAGPLWIVCKPLELREILDLLTGLEPEKGAVRKITFQRQTVHGAGLLDTWQTAEKGDQLPEELRAARSGGIILHFRQGKIRRCHSGGTKAGVHCKEPAEAAREKTCSHEQHESDSHLRGSKSAAKRVARGAANASAFGEASERVADSRAQRGAHPNRCCHAAR